MPRIALAAALFVAAVAAVPAHADAFAVDPFDRGWFGVIVAYSGETGDQIDARSLKLGLVFRARWIELQYAPWNAVDVNGLPDNVEPYEFGPIQSAFRLSGPWRLAPFLEYRSDLLRDIFEDSGPKRADRALGLRYQLDRHWTAEAYVRHYDYEDVQRTPPLTPIDVVTDTYGLTIEWEF
jgi:hypothetical protein